MAEEKESTEMYSGPIAKTVFRNIIPAMLTSLLALVYNIADTYFIGQTHNDYMVAAVSLAAPVYLIFMALGTLFGVGGASVISRDLGRGNRERADRVSSFCTWTCVGVGILFMLVLWIFMDQILVLLGASSETMEYTRSYLTIVTSCGVFSMLVNCYSNLIRAEGKPTMAVVGMVAGNLINLVLDPVFILGLGWGTSGAAIATVIGQDAGALIYIVYVLTGHFSFSASIRDFQAGDHICSNVLTVGIPASLTSLLMSFSQIIANSMISDYGDMAVAGYAVAGKVRMCIAVTGNGIGQGLQPILAYCYGNQNRKRFSAFLRFSCLFALILFTAATVVCYIFTGPIVKAFLTQDSALEYGMDFTRILLLSAWSIGIFSVFLNTLQSMGSGGPSLLASISRQGLFYIPLLFILRAFMGLYGLIYAQPAAELISLVIVAVLTWVTVRKFLKPEDGTPA